MSAPPYHLRPNKAIDRHLFVELIRRLGPPDELSAYTYYGFGGPYLEDYRVLAEHFPELALVSFETDRQVYLRQRFHLPCSGIRLKNTDFGTFLARTDLSTSRNIFWLDFVSLEYSCFTDFMGLISKVAPGTVVKVTGSSPS